MDDFKVSLNLNETSILLEKGLSNSEKIDYKIMMSDNKNMVILFVYEKYFFRMGNRLTLTITLDNFEGCTRVHCVSAGGGAALTGIDWGASSSYASEPREILEKFIL